MLEPVNNMLYYRLWNVRWSSCLVGQGDSPTMSNSWCKQFLADQWMPGMLWTYYYAGITCNNRLPGDSQAGDSLFTRNRSGLHTCVKDRLEHSGVVSSGVVVYVLICSLVTSVPTLVIYKILYIYTVIVWLITVATCSNNWHCKVGWM